MAKAKKNTTDNISFTKSVNAIKKAAKVINDQVSKTAGEVQADIYANGEQLVDMANQTVKETLAKVDLSVNVEENVDKVKATTKKINAVALETADDLVDGMYTTGKAWQGLAEKAVKGGMSLAAKQQEILFTTLEDMKGEVSKGAKRFSKLFSNN